MQTYGQLSDHLAYAQSGDLYQKSQGNVRDTYVEAQTAYGMAASCFPPTGASKNVCVTAYSFLLCNDIS